MVVKPEGFYGFRLLQWRPSVFYFNLVVVSFLSEFNPSGLWIQAKNQRHRLHPLELQPPCSLGLLVYFILMHMIKFNSRIYVKLGKWNERKTYIHLLIFLLYIGIEKNPVKSESLVLLWSLISSEQDEWKDKILFGHKILQIDQTEKENIHSPHSGHYYYYYYCKILKSLWIFWSSERTYEV